MKAIVHDMYGIGGHDVIRRVRSWSDLPIMVLTVRDIQDEKVASLNARRAHPDTRPRWLNC